MALAPTGGEEAASWFRQAIDPARSQQARSLERRAEGSELPAPVYGWFTAGLLLPI